jgi:hypothetical protein
LGESTKSLEYRRRPLIVQKLIDEGLAVELDILP